MITIICSILVITSHFQVRTEASGILLKSNESNYLVDFSKEATENGWEGNYSKKIVPKQDCIKE